MKKLLSRLPSNRLLTRPLWTVAIAVVAFAALELLAVQQALAGIACCTNTTFNDCACDTSVPATCGFVKNGKTYGVKYINPITKLSKSCSNSSISGDISTIRSEIECTGVFEETFLETTSLQRIGTVNCAVTQSSHDDTAVCELDLKYSRPAGLTQCTDNLDGTSTLTYAGFCSQALGGSTQNKLAVTGTLKCPASLQNDNALPLFCEGNLECKLNLGIAGLSSGQCDDVGVFPPDGQVLSFFQTVQGSTCSMESTIIEYGQLSTLYCNGGTFDGAPVDCVFGTGKTAKLLTGIGIAEPAITFDVTFAPTTLNTNCSPNNNDTWHFTIIGNDQLDLAQIKVSSLAVEGVGAAGPGNQPPSQVTCDSINTAQNTRTCHINACSTTQEDLGPRVAELNPGSTADLTVTGTLMNGTPIFGEDAGHHTSGNN